MQRQLTRDSSNKVLAGVCSGIANYANLDVGVVRLLTFLLFIFSGGIVLIIYIVLAIALPENGPLEMNDKENSTNQFNEKMKKQTHNEYALDQSEYIIDEDEYKLED